MRSEPIPTSPPSSKSPPGRYTALWFLRLLGLAVPVAICAVATTVGPAWFWEQPRISSRGNRDMLARAFDRPDRSLRRRSCRNAGLRVAVAPSAEDAGAAASHRGRLLAGLFVPGGTSWSRTRRRGLAIVDTATSCVAYFLRASAPDDYRIVVLGGSSALGEPYRPWLSVGQIVAWKLEQAVPSRHFVCEILAWLGHSLEQQHLKLAEIERRPDAVIIYSGHNEFAARFGEERDAAFAGESANWLMRLAYEAASISQFRHSVARSSAGTGSMPLRFPAATISLIHRSVANGSRTRSWSTSAGGWKRSCHTVTRSVLYRS